MPAWAAMCGYNITEMRIAMGKMKRALVFATALIFLFTGVCAGSVRPAQAAGKVKLSKTSLKLVAGTKKQLKVKNKKGRKVTWKSSKKKIASVSKKGKIKAKKAGRARITATVSMGKGKKKKLVCKLTVLPKSTTDDKDSVADNSGEENPSSVTVSPEELTPEKIYSKMIALKDKYPDGTKWDGNSSYDWNGGIYKGGAGCMGFAFMLSDAAFGRLPARKLTFSQISLGDIRVGDIVRYLNDTHGVVILEKKENSFLVAEGNFNKSVHWGREVSFAEIQESGSYVITRYPK